MKLFFTLILGIACCSANAQWIDNSNQFQDSLHTPICTAAGTQKNPIVITSYPDGGYFVIWEDQRSNSTTKTDIYAQKFDSNGVRRWLNDGIAIANNANAEHFTVPSGDNDYRNRSYACTDSAGGFYIAFVDDSIATYTWQRLWIQHVQSNGNKVFGGEGSLISTSATANLDFAPQLIADGNKGFYMAWKNTSSNDYVNAYCYRDEGGFLRLYGGDRMNNNAVQTSSTGLCGIKTDVVYPGTNVIDFKIWSDGEQGCNVLIDMSGNIGTQGRMLCFNRLFRAKKNSFATVSRRNASGTACPRIESYIKGDVYPLYRLAIDFQSVTCGGPNGSVYAYTNYRLLSNGYRLVSAAGYNYAGIKGTTVKTAGNINVDVLAAATRTYNATTGVSNYSCQAYTYGVENFDSIPYERTSYSNPDFGYNTVAPATLNKLNLFRDTILGISTYYGDFSLASGSNQIYATGLGGVGTRKVRLQHLEVNRITADSFAIQYKTNPAGTPEKQGVAIGSEISTGFSGSNISYDVPLVLVANNGKAFFYTREYYRSVRVSPIGTGAALLWGAMGRPMATGAFDNSYYNLEQPMASLNTSGTRAFVVWRDNKYIPGNSAENIFGGICVRLNETNYLPPFRPVNPAYSYSTLSNCNPAVLYGTTNKYSPLEVYNSYNRVGMSTVAAILDNTYLGAIQMSLFNQINSPARRYNGDAYLHRNYSFQPDSIRANASINMKLYFTKADFNALQNADPTITDPGQLAVIWQAGTTLNAPATYTPAIGEKVISVIGWDSVAGGYSINVLSPGRGFIFIKKETTNTICNGQATSFVSNITGTTYQWQVNNGSGFATISNGGNYAGATTATLQISNATQALNNYRYRCLVDGTKYSNSFSLQVANVWTGAISNLWENAGNWSCNEVPTATTDVLIKAGSPTVNSTTAICRSITAAAGSTVNVLPGFTLTITH